MEFVDQRNSDHDHMYNAGGSRRKSSKLSRRRRRGGNMNVHGFKPWSSNDPNLIADRHIADRHQFVGGSRHKLSKSRRGGFSFDNWKEFQRMGNEDLQRYGLAGGSRRKSSKSSKSSKLSKSRRGGVYR